MDVMRNVVLFVFLLGVCLASCKRHSVDRDRYSLYVAKDTFELEMSIDSKTERISGSFDKLESDTAYKSFYTGNKELKFGLKSEIDSLFVSLSPNKEITINLEKEGMSPLVLKIKNGIHVKPLQFDIVSKNEDIVIKYEDGLDNPYLQELRRKYPIDSIVHEADSDLDRVKRISSWVHNLWEHDGYSEPEKYDALYILDEVKKGRRFRCVEYGLVTTTCLNSIGIKARVLALKTEDVETRYSGAGHVVLEVFLNDLEKWVMVDPQWDVIAHLDGIPLNAVELQNAVTMNENVKIWTSGNTTVSMYVPWIYPYLYYFSVNFDNRVNCKEQYLYKEKRDLMLVPEGIKKPTVFQQRFPMDYFIYTHSIKNFYGKPD